MPDVFAWAPTIENYSGTATLKTRKAVFGDGYTQDVEDGINNRSSTYSLQFRGKADKITAILAFLDARAGATRFYWSPPFRGQLLFICSTYNEPTKDGDVWTMTATFEQRF